eukprot:4077489-Pyramimonas_sp.AAC.1
MSAVTRQVVSTRPASAWQNRIAGTVTKGAATVPRTSSTLTSSHFSSFDGSVRFAVCSASKGKRSIFPGFAAGAVKQSVPIGRRALSIQKTVVNVCCQPKCAFLPPPQAVVAPAKLSTEEAATKYGFEIVKKEFISEYNSDATLFRHKKTGAEVGTFSYLFIDCAAGLSVALVGSP